jgi:predicted N-acyltransferase
MPRSPIPSPARVSDPAWVTLFNRQSFLDAHRAPADVPVHLAHADALTCGFSAPFGGLDFARPRETPTNVEATLDSALDQAAALGARHVSVRCRPAAWSANDDVSAFALLNRGFAVVDADLAYVVDLSAYASAGDYVDALKSPARRALRHAFAAPFELVDSDDWAAAYAVLAANRASRGWTLSLSWERVAQLRELFPGEVRMFELRHAGALVAAALVMAARDDAWFVPAWGDADHDLPRSPMNILAYAVIERALQDRVRLLDLGTSTVPAADGTRRANAGLVQFKQSILATGQLRTVLAR